ncbi:hypothetical protein TIFTF001_011910 [Ficus carica]|uniref:Uncharacterized protein n=1 Tax=Ficus carica TaxID=3494 RepID=A0AA88D5S6_FICCA|nr:hypothetical protein TIFTF001_011910 [Ficus carica]
MDNKPARWLLPCRRQTDLGQRVQLGVRRGARLPRELVTTATFNDGGGYKGNLGLALGSGILSPNHLAAKKETIAGEDGSEKQQRGAVEIVGDPLPLSTMTKGLGSLAINWKSRS